MFLSGDHLAIDSVNTFRLVEPILLNFALGVSMNFVTNVSLGPPNPPVPPKDLIIAAVGADFDIQ